MDDLTGTYGGHPAVEGADVGDILQDGVSRLSDAVTKGIPDAAISGGLSIYNTFLDYTGQDKLDTTEAIGNLMGDDAANYYQQHKTGIDVAGFIGTSLIPGTLGVKMLKLAAAGEALGPIARGLGFMESGVTTTLGKGLNAIAESGGAITEAVNAAKNANLAYSVASNALMGIAAETAVVATMKDSPMFDGFTYGDFAKDIMMGGIFAGAIGGVIENAFVRGIVNKAGKAVSVAKNEFTDAFGPSQLGLSMGDEIALHAQKIVQLPDEYTNLPFTYTWQGNKITAELPTAGAFKTARASAEKSSLDQLRLKMNELAGGDTTGQAMFKRFMNTLQQARSSGADADDQWEQVSGLFTNLKKVEALTPDDGEIKSPKQFFLNQKPTGTKDWLTDIRGADTGKQAYYLADDLSKAKTVDLTTNTQFKSAKEAFDAGYDLVQKRKGGIAVNPKSQIIRATPDLALKNSYYLDLESGSLAHQVFPTAADLMSRHSDFSWAADRVTIGKKVFQQADSLPFTADMSAMDSSSRYMWASKLDERFFKNQGSIDGNDFALLDRLRELPKLKDSEEISIALDGGHEVPLSEITDLNQFVNQQKLRWLEESLSEKAQDARLLRTHLNVSQDWYERAVGSNFQPTSKELLQEARSPLGYFEPKSVKLSFDRNGKELVNAATGKIASPSAMMGPNLDTTHILGQHYNALIRKTVGNNVADSILGPDADKFTEFTDRIASGANAAGPSGGFLTSANANYGDSADLWAQHHGKQLHGVLAKGRENVTTAIAPGTNAVRASKEAAAELGVLTTALRRNPDYFYLVTEEAEDGSKTYRLVDREAVQSFEGDKEGSKYSNLEDAIKEVQGKLGDDGKPRVGQYKIQNTEVGQFLDQWHGMNSDAIKKRQSLATAMGAPSTLDSRVIKAPPVDTQRYKYFAFVKSKPRIGQPDEIAMITAKDPEQLRELARKVPDDYEVHYDRNTQDFYKAQGQYSYDQTISESRINSSLHRAGVLGDFFPETRAENVLQDWVQYAQNQSDNVLRTATQVKNRDTFNQLQFLAEQHDLAQTSQFASTRVKKQGVNPYTDYVRRMLDLPSTGHYPLMDSLNEFADNIGRQAWSKLDALRDALGKQKPGEDLATLDQVNNLMDRYGLNPGYGKDFQAYLLANQKFGGNLLRSTLTKVNSWLATTIQRLDFISPIVNTISTPIMLGTELSSIRKLASESPELAGKLSELMTTPVPGSQIQFPSTTKLIYQGLRNFWNDDGKLLQRYTDTGNVSTIPQQVKDVLGDLAYRPEMEPAAWKQKLDAALAKGAKLTGSDFHEQMTRFVSADVMRQLTDPLVQAGKMTVAEQDAYIGTFVNRVQGNYVRTQRPQIFGGTVGAAIGLFQTYQFNVLQQLFRHMQDGNAKALLTFGGLQTSIYGLNGLPFFNAINQHVIGNASGNVNHADAYTTAPQMLGKQLGDWLMYGTASAFPLFGGKGPALYSRGDINPRNSTVIPTSLDEVPAVSASMHLAQTVYNFGKQVANGADMSGAMLQALEHQGWSRPLAGLAQTLQGRSTTGDGSTVTAAAEMHSVSLMSNLYDRLVSFGGAERMLGAKPMDEAIALQQLYRQKDYDALNREKLEALGAAVKSKLVGNQVPDQEELQDFMADYAKAGGRIESFHGAMQRWMKDANTSVINQVAQRLSSPSGRNMQMLMGGRLLQDYNTLALEQPPEEQ